MNSHTNMASTLSTPLSHGSLTMKKIITQLSLVMLLIGIIPATTYAADNVLQSIDYSTLPGEQMEFVFTLKNKASEPLAFTIDDPARIAFDLPNTDNGLAQKSQRIGVGSVRSINSAQGRQNACRH